MLDSAAILSNLARSAQTSVNLAAGSWKVELSGTLSVKLDSLKRTEASVTIMLASCTTTAGVGTRCLVGGGGLLLGVSPTSSLVRFRVAYPRLVLLLAGALNPATRPIVDKPREEFALVIGRVVLGPDVAVLDKVRLDLDVGFVVDVD